MQLIVCGELLGDEPVELVVGRELFGQEPAYVPALIILVSRTEAFAQLGECRQLRVENVPK